MLDVTKTAQQKRLDFKAKLDSGKLLKFPGSFSPLVSLLIEQLGFDGIYISGAILSADLGLPDIGLTTLSEVSKRGYDLTRYSNLPSLIDVDTGFGEPMSAARTVAEMENLGLSACHFEDQVNPKRCGHLDNKTIVESQVMVRRIQAAAKAKKDQNFMIMARTDARASEGLDKAIDRAKAYVDAGANMIFPEALRDPSEFEAFRKEIKVPLLANMTEFGKSKLLTAKQIESLGYNMVIYPVTTLRLAMGAVEKGLKTIMEEGTQESLLSEMQTRKRLYEVIKYEDFNQFDQDVFNFTV